MTIESDAADLSRADAIDQLRRVSRELAEWATSETAQEHAADINQALAVLQAPAASPKAGDLPLPVGHRWVHVTVLCDAKLRESWRIAVPDEVTDPDAVREFCDDALSPAVSETVMNFDDEQAFDEENRELHEVVADDARYVADLYCDNGHRWRAEVIDVGEDTGRWPEDPRHCPPCPESGCGSTGALL
jgi:hypothetical protein